MAWKGWNIRKMRLRPGRTPLGELTTLPRPSSRLGRGHPSQTTPLGAFGASIAPLHIISVYATAPSGQIPGAQISQGLDDYGGKDSKTLRKWRCGCRNDDLRVWLLLLEIDSRLNAAAANVCIVSITTCVIHLFIALLVSCFYRC